MHFGICKYSLLVIVYVVYMLSKAAFSILLSDETKVIHGASPPGQYGSFDPRRSHLNPTSAVDGASSPTTIPEIF